MNSGERFDEAAPMIISALKTGFIEGDGKIYNSRAPRSGRGRSKMGRILFENDHRWLGGR
jgi:hypothetical protein